MQLRPLGRSGLMAAPLALGGNVFGWTANQADSFAVLDAFVAGGFNLIDTADSYSRWVSGHSGGESETLIGQWLHARGGRDRVLIATKVASAMGEPGEGRGGLSRRWIRQAVQDSLRRLQTDHIDLYQAHVDDTQTPLEETLSAFAELIGEGTVRAIGASNYSAPRLAEALAVSARLDLPRYEVLQPEHNLTARSGYEGALEALTQREGMGVIPWGALARGFLTGKYRSAADLAQSPRGERIRPLLGPTGQRILAALDDVGAAHGAKPAQVALAWQMARPGITAPIASATRAAQWHELAGAAALRLSADDIQRLDTASA